VGSNAQCSAGSSFSVGGFIVVMLWFYLSARGGAHERNGV
jgi:hypothetical protein